MYVQEQGQRRALSVLLALLLAVVGLGTGFPVRALAATAGTGGAFVAVSPSGKLVDTRSALGIKATLGSASTNSFQVLGEAGVPSSGVSAVSLTVVATNPTGDSYVELWPDGTTEPSPASMLNFNTGQTISNTALVAVGADGKIDVFNHAGTVDLVVTVSGYFTSSASGSGAAPGGYVPVTQSRLVDTRNGTGAPEAQIPPGGSITVPVDGTAGISDASSVFVNLTVPSPAAEGLLYAYATGASPGQPALDYPAETTADAATVTVGSNGSITLENGSATESIDVVVDVYGYFTPSVTQGGAFTAVQARLLDTRTTTAVPADGTVTVTVGGTHGIPTYGIGGAVLNLTTADQTTQGFLVAWPTGQAMPDTSSANYEADSDRADLAIVQPGTNGTISIYNHSAASVELVVDLQGWFSAIEPSIPVDLESGATDSTAPILSGVVYGPTGDAITGEIFVTDSSGNPVDGFPTATGTVATGERVTYQFPDGSLTTGQTYSWYMMACYQSLCSAPTATQSFTLTTPPTVTPPTAPANATTVTLSGASLTGMTAISDATGCSGAACPVNTSPTALNVGGDGTNHWISALKADLSGIPAGSTTYSATLALAQDTCLNGCTGDTLDMDLATDDVDAQTTGSALLALADTTDPYATGAESGTSFDLTDAVNAWLTGAEPNDGLIIQAADQGTATTGVGYYSAAASSPTADVPQLTVVYTPPTVPGAPASVNATAGDGGALLTWTPPTDSGYVDATDDAITGYVLQAVGPTGTVVQQVNATGDQGVLTGLTDGTAYTFTVAATNSVGTGPTITTASAATPTAVTGGPSPYIQAVTQYLDAQDQLEESPTATVAAVTADDAMVAGFTSPLTAEAGDDTGVAALEAANDETDSQDSTALTTTLAIPTANGVTLYATTDETFTTTDASGGTAVSTPGENIDDQEFFLTASASTPFLTGSIDADEALAPVVAGSNTTATSTTAAPVADDTPSWDLDSSDNLALVPGDDAVAEPDVLVGGGGGGGSLGNAGVAAWAHSHAYTPSNEKDNRFPDDCTDFVSDALYYGGHFRMVYTHGYHGMPVNTANNSYWFMWDETRWSNSWSVAHASYQRQQQLGAWFVSERADMAPGDIVYGDMVNSSSSSSQIDHAGILYSLNGNNLWVAQHSHNRFDPIYKVTGYVSWQNQNPHLHIWVAQPVN